MTMPDWLRLLLAAPNWITGVPDGEMMKIRELLDLLGRVSPDADVVIVDADECRDLAIERVEVSARTGRVEISGSYDNPDNPPPYVSEHG